MNQQKYVRVTLIRSTNKKLRSHKACVLGLGLRHMHHTVDVIDNVCTRGMMKQVSYLIKVEEL